MCQECADFTVVIHSSVRNKLLVDTWGRLSRRINDTFEGILRQFGFFLQSDSFIKCLRFPVKRDKGAHRFLISRLTSLDAGLPSSAPACIVSSLRLNLRVPSLTAELFAAICLFSAQACRRTMAPMLATLTLACLGIKTAIVPVFFYIQLQNVSKCVHALGLGRTCSIAWPQFDFFYRPLLLSRAAIVYSEPFCFMWLLPSSFAACLRQALFQGFNILQDLCRGGVCFSYSY